MQAFAAFLKSLGATRIMAMGAVTIALVGFFAFLILRATSPQMTTLFTDLSVEDSSAIIKDLERQGIPYEMRGDGSTLLVQKDKVTRLRMKLAEGGLPKGGGVGYEIFDKSDALGATSFVQNINHLRALEGEIARTIRAIDRVQAARVHLVLPERQLFSREKAEPSASIALKVRGSLDPQQVRAIRHLVASAVNGMKPARVSVVDEAGRLLADGNADELAGGNADERKIAFERRMREQVESIVTSVVGPGRARVQLTADFDFNRITQTSDKYDPESRVVRSSQTREEASGSAADGNSGAVSVGNELPGANRTAEGAQQQRDSNRKSEEIVNYEINRTTKTEVTEGGRMTRVSVAVVVDGNYTKNDKGELAYEPRPKEEIDRIAALVRTAIGFDAKRGDQVEVANLRLAEVPSNPIIEPSGFMSMFQFTKDDLMHGIELFVMALLGLIALMFGVRPLVRKVLTPEPGSAAASAAAVAAAASASAAAKLPAPSAAEAAAALPNRAVEMIEIAQVQGAVHAQSVEKVGELADNNPNETVAIIRSWLHEAAA
ncbi:MAG: flagellar basal-body MS-ring/collar protein FliF [Pseudomonadota bacterium]